jgi:N6-L-threonylcarbamoyladenine synthase
MRAADVMSVVAIETTSFDVPWSERLFLDDLGAAGRYWLVAENDGEIVGYAGGWVLDDEAHLMNLAVGGGARGRGIGRVLLSTLMTRMGSAGASRITLEVRPANTAAVALYESVGLRREGLRPGYYAETGEDALIMWGELPASPDTASDGAAPDGPPALPLILAIETSCDETAAAVMRGGTVLYSNVIASQVDFHSRFGGVVPEIASRKHTEAIVGVVEQAMCDAGEMMRSAGDPDAPESGQPLAFSALDAIGVTYGPGLVGALVVGLAYAKGLALAAGLPLIGVNHLEGHIFANMLADPEVRPPLVASLVSGGNTSLTHVPRWGEYHTLGETLDDAVGEAFDKVAKVLGLGYPGGPVLSRLAAEGDPAAVDFPRAMLHSGDYSFSLSGLKTAVINHIRHKQQAGIEIDLPDLAASFQAAVVDVQVAKAVRAVKETGVKVFCLGGGVAANPALREALRAAIEPLGVHVSVPPFHLCADNAAMIAAAAHYRYCSGERLGLEADAVPGLRLDTP